MWVFSGKVFVTFHTEYLGDLFMNDFDGYYGGNVQQHKRYAYTKCWVAKSEMW